MAAGVLVGRGYVSIRPEFEGNWARQAQSRLASAGRAGGSAFGAVFGKTLSAGMKTVIPALGSSVTAALAPAAGAAGLLAPAMLAAQSASTALKIGMIGVGDAVSEALDPSSPEAFAEAMEKLSPNARAFVSELRSMKPELDAVKTSVQDALFEEMGDTFREAASTTLPIFKNALTNSAGALNLMGRNVLNTAVGLGESGALGTALSSANSGLYNLSGIPATIVQGLVQIGAAAGPSFARLTDGAGSAFASLSQKMAAAFESGAMERFIESGVRVLEGLGGILADAFATVGNILGTATEAGTEVLAVIGEVFAELRRVTALPEVQAALRSVFAAVAQIAQAIAPVIGAAVQAIMPLLAAIAPVIGDLAARLGPVLAQLATTLGAALQPILDALLPVVTLVGDALIQVITAITPLLMPISELITGIIQAVTPALKPLLGVIVMLIDTLVGPLSEVIRTLTPVFTTIAGVIADVVVALAGPLADVISGLMPVITLIADVIAQVFAAIEPFLKPLVALIGQVAGALVGVLVSGLNTLMEAIKPLIPVGISLVQTVLSAMMPILPQVASAVVMLVQAFAPLFPVVAQIATLLMQMGVNILMQLLPPVMQLIQATVGLALALVPILPPLVQIIALVLNLAVKVLAFLLPPLVTLVALLIGAFVRAFSVAIGVLRNVVTWFSNVVTWVRTRVGPAFRWLNDKVIQPVWRAIRSAVSTAYHKGIRPIFDSLRSAVGKVADAFTSAKDAIKKQWDKLKGIAKGPVNFIINTVYTKGIRKVWNKVAGAFGAPALPEVKGLATGGVLPGYTPGRDVHLAALSGGEAVMRPEWTRAVGADYVGAMNAAARRGGIAGVQRELGVPGFKDGGIFGWIKDTASKGLDLAKAGVSWLKDGIKSSVRAGVERIVNPLLDKISGSASAYRDMVSGVPGRMIRVMFDFSDQADKKLAEAGVGGKGTKNALSWARRQAGRPYLWGGVGPVGYDCSGFMSAIQNVIQGKKPYTRRWATGAFRGGAPAGWERGLKSPFMVGITHAGVGHTAGTLNNVNVESRGGDGVVVGKRARGYKSGLFSSWYGFRPAKQYDNGGWLQPGWTSVHNGLGEPEAVLTPRQLRALEGAAGVRNDGTPSTLEGQLYLDSGEFLGVVRGVVQERDRRLTSVIRAGRKG